VHASLLGVSGWSCVSYPFHAHFAFVQDVAILSKHGKTNKRRKASKAAKRRRIEARARRLEAKERGHVIPDISTLAFERQLRKIATSGGA
jgi:hypothetical protein